MSFPRLLLVLLLFAGGCAAPTPAPPSSARTLPSAAATSPPRATPSFAAAPRARWTWMVYVDANTDLERLAMGDLRELLAVGSTRDVEVIVLCGRSPESDEDEDYTAEGVANLADWTSCKLLHVEKGRLTELDDWGHANMADGATLARFIETVRRRYPADRYALFLDDHGMGWEGCCGDETAEAGKDQLTLPALTDALRQGMGDERLALLGFDACLMANLEVARAVAPCARYMVASEESEPAEGWDYAPVLRRLQAKPDLDGAALGRLVAQTYMKSFDKDEETREEGAGATMSVIDLSRVEALSRATDALADACAARVRLGRDGWVRVARARSKSEAYGAAADGDDETPAELYDLGSFVSSVQADLPAARPAAERVRAALRAAVIWSAHGAARPDASGLSIFLPKRAAALKRAEPLAYADVVGAAGRRWIDFLQAYTAATEAQKTPPRLGSLTCRPRVVRNGAPVTLRASAPPGEIDQAWFVLGDEDGKESMIIGRTQVKPDARGVLQETWDGCWFKLSDGRNTVICPLSALDEVSGKAGEYTAQVPAELRRGRQKSWRDVTLEFYIRDRADGTVDGRLTHAYEDTRYGPREVALRKGDRVRPLYSEIDASGEESWVYSDEAEEQLHLAKAGGLTLVYAPIEPGTWRVGFVVTDFADNFAQRWIDVEVED